MSRILVWDFPIRILHWLFAGSLTGALVLGFAVDDEHPLFAYHMLLGLAAGFLLVLRLLLGIIGSRHARFAAWSWSPRELLAYVGGIFQAGGKRYVSHNPASAWVTAAMFGLVAVLVVTGVVLGTRSFSKDVHEVLAVLLATTIGLHLAGLAWHTLRHRENIARSMVDGRKEGPAAAALPSSYRIAGLLLGIVAVGWTVALFRGYDARSRRVQLPFTPVVVQLGETPDLGHAQRAKRSRHHHE